MKGEKYIGMMNIISNFVRIFDLILIFKKYRK